MTIEQLAIFIPAAIVVALSPGANNLLAFSNGSRQGLPLAIIALSGRCAAFVLMIGMVVLGLGALLEASELAFQIVKWVGVAYLAYLGVKMFFDRDVHGVEGGVAAVSGLALAKREFIVAMSNPKAVLLFTAFVPQFIASGSGASFAVQLITLGALYIVIEFLAAVVWAIAGAFVRSLKPSAKKMILMNRITGSLMIGAAAMLASARKA